MEAKESHDGTEKVRNPERTSENPIVVVVNLICSYQSHFLCYVKWAF